MQVDALPLATPHIAHFQREGIEQLYPPQAETVDAGISAFTDETNDRRVGLFGLLSAFRNDDVQRTIGTMIEATERAGRAQAPDRSN